AGHLATARQRQHDHLLARGAQPPHLSRGQAEYPQSAAGQARVGRREQQVAATSADMPGVHSNPTVRSTTEATSPPGGYSRARPMTMPRTVGSLSAIRQRAATAPSSAVASPPSRSIGSEVA